LSSHLSNRTKKPICYLSFTLSSSLFSSTSPCSSSALHGRWIDDGEALEWSGRLEQPIAAARPQRGPSQTCRASGLERPRWRVLRIVLLVRLLLRRVLRIVLIARGTRFRCRHPLGTGRSLNWLGPTSSDLPPYRVCDLIKRQYTFWRLRWGTIGSAISYSRSF
jgi:hypothetical protein